MAIRYGRSRFGASAAAAPICHNNVAGGLYYDPDGIGSQGKVQLANP